MRSPYYSARRVWIPSTPDLLNMDGKTLTVFHLDGKSDGRETTLRVMRGSPDSPEAGSISIVYGSSTSDRSDGIDDGSQCLTAAGVAAIIPHRDGLPGRGDFLIQVPII